MKQIESFWLNNDSDKNKNIKNVFLVYRQDSLDTDSNLKSRMLSIGEILKMQHHCKTTIKAQYKEILLNDYSNYLDIL